MREEVTSIHREFRSLVRLVAESMNRPEIRCGEWYSRSPSLTN